MSEIHICLVEPEIPQNTGNIARTCAVTGAALHLVRPLGFEIDDAKLKRAGLDYWDKLNITYYNSLTEFMEIHRDDPLYFFTTKGKKCYTDVVFPERVFLVFGKETKGLPEPLLEEHVEKTLRIPMRSELRSLNLSNSVAVAVYEVLRQDGFRGLMCGGKLAEN